MENPFGKVKELRILAWTILWVVAIIGVCEYAFSHGWPWKISVLEPYMLRGRGDGWVHCAFELQRIKHRNRTNEDGFFVFIGGSTGLEAITQDALVEEKLRETTGKKIGFSSLCSSYKSFSDETKIVEELGDFGGILLIGMEALRLKTSIDEQLEKVLTTGNTIQKHFYLSSSDRINRILSDYGLRVDLTQRFLLFRTMEMIGVLVKRSGLHFLSSRGEIRRLVFVRNHAAEKKPPLNTEDREKFKTTTFPKIIEKCRKNGKMNMDLLGEVINIAQQNNNRVVLVDMPINPLFQHEMEKFHVTYDEMILDLVKESGVKYIDMRDAAEWTHEDFRDIHHARSPGQKKFSDALVHVVSGYP